jgi:hypothetical protein
VKDDGAGIGRQYFKDLIVGQVFNIEFTRARGEKTAGKASVATKLFQGIRIDVKHCGPIRREWPGNPERAECLRACSYPLEIGSG